MNSLDKSPVTVDFLIDWALLREVLRVLKPGGKLLIIAEGFKDWKVDNRYQKLIELLNISPLSVNEHSELFSRAGYSDIQVFEENDKGWMCGIGKKPA